MFSAADIAFVSTITVCVMNVHTRLQLFIRMEWLMGDHEYLNGPRTEISLFPFSVSLRYSMQILTNRETAVRMNEQWPTSTGKEDNNQ